MIIYLFTTIKKLVILQSWYWFGISSDLEFEWEPLIHLWKERVSIWNAGMTLFKQKPFLGRRSTNLYALLSTYFATLSEHAHSIYIDTDIELLEAWLELHY